MELFAPLDIANDLIFGWTRGVFQIGIPADMRGNRKGQWQLSMRFEGKI